MLGTNRLATVPIRFIPPRITKPVMLMSTKPITIFVVLVTVTPLGTSKISLTA